MYLVVTKRRTSRPVASRTDNSHTFYLIYLSALKPKACAAHNSHTVRDNLIIFSRDIYQVNKECRMQEGQLLLCLFFLVISPEQISKQYNCALYDFLMV